MAVMFLVSPLHYVHAMQGAVGGALFASIDAAEVCIVDGAAPGFRPAGEQRPDNVCPACILANGVPALPAPDPAVPPRPDLRIARAAVAPSDLPASDPQHRPSQPRAPPLRS